MGKLTKVFIGCLITSIGVIILGHSHLATGGTAGLSLALAYMLQLPFAAVFFLINIPFYIFSFINMGRRFTLSTIAAVAMLSLMTGVDRWLPVFSIPPLIGAVVGGIIVGAGVSFVLTSGTSLGGTNMLALYLKKKHKIDPGAANFVFDSLVVAFSFYSIGIPSGIMSVLSIAVTSLIISCFKERIPAGVQAQGSEAAA